MGRILKIRKRDGSVQDFQPEKLTKGLEKSILEAKLGDGKLAKKLSQQVIGVLEKHYSEKLMPSTEDVHEILEETLQGRLLPIWKAFAAFRQKNKESIGFRTFMGVRDDIGLTPNALKVLGRRYLLRNEQGNIIETPARLFRRVAKAIAHQDLIYDKKANVKRVEEEFYQAMAQLDFLPNTPTLMNAGTELGQLSACFVIPVGDSLPQIFDAVKHMAVIHQSAGGTGFSFSSLRPKGDLVKSTKGVASGPVSFMRIFDVTTDVIKQGGKRRGANMGVLNVSHPDIVEFITAKAKEGMLANFNVSIGTADKFMNAVEQDREWELVNPRTKQIVRRVKAKEIFDLIVNYAWQTGDPGLVFLDEINRTNPTAFLGEIETTNPCGEQPLHPFESCNLGSINVSRFVRNEKPEWERLRKIVHLGVHFLDNVIDANKYPLPETDAITRANRRIGLGIMGFADMLARMRLAYDSPKALEFAERLMKFIQDEARKASMEIGVRRGSFQNFPQSTLAKKYKFMRNATVTTVAPTGTISIIANCSSGIEPLFAVSYVREVLEGTQLVETNQWFKQVSKERKFYSKQLMLRIAKEGSIQKVSGIPQDVKRVFVTSFDIKPEWHVKMQASFQKFVDNAVSKTVNLPEKATVEDVRKIYLQAWKLKCKGITVYRYGSKKEQVLYVGKEQPVAVQSEYSGGCPTGECAF